MKLNQKERALHQQFSQYGRNAKEWLRKCALLLPEIERSRVWKKRGFSSIYEYAGKLAGMSHSSVTEALRIGRRVADKPLLRKVIEKHGLQRVRPVAAIATKETEAFWAEKASTLSKNALEIFVKNYRLESLPREDLKPEKVQLEVSPEVADQLNKMKGEQSLDDLLKELMELKAQNAAGQKPKAKRASRHIPNATKRYVLSKTGKKCAFPRCHKPYYQLPHTQRWALDKVHDPDRLQPLCKTHNELAHSTLIENEEGAPETWRIRRKVDKQSPKYAIDQRVALHRGG